VKRSKPMAGTALKRTAVLARTSRKRKPARDTGPSPKVRALVLDRDGFLCVRCGISAMDRPRSIHHRVRRGQGGRHVPENLITLCGDGLAGCHGWVHRNIAESRASGWLLLGTDNPLTEGVMYASEHGSGVTLWLTPGGGHGTDGPRDVAA
jgi:hypothetical protein